MKKNKYLAYLTGVYLSDGSCFKQSRGYVFKLSSIDISYIEYTNKCLKNLINKTGLVKEDKWVKRSDDSYSKNSTKPIYYIRIYEKELFEYLTIETDNKQKIPEWIRCSNEKIKKEFLAGMIDGDGWVCFGVSGLGHGIHWQVGLSGKEEMLKQVQTMCNTINLKTTGTVSKIKTSKDTYRLFFNVLSIIESKLTLRIIRKQKRINYIKKILRDYTLISKSQKRIARILG